MYTQAKVKASPGCQANGKKLVSYCRRCLKDTPHQRGKRGSYHCLACGAENASLRPRGNGGDGLPPGFLLERTDTDTWGLFAEMPVVKADQRVRFMHYLKGVFPTTATRREIVDRAWEIYRGLNNR